MSEIKDTDKKSQEFKDKIEEQIGLAVIEEGIKDNQFEYVHADGVKYRVRKPVLRERQEIYEKKMAKFNSLLENPIYKLEDTIKKTYREKHGIDIDGMSKKILNLETQKQAIMLKLGQTLKDKGSEQDMNILKGQIEDIANEQNNLSFKKSGYLEFSIENQILTYSYSYLAYLVSEKEVDGKWVKAFETYDDYIGNEDETLINQLSFRSVFVIKHEI